MRETAVSVKVNRLEHSCGTREVTKTNATGTVQSSIYIYVAQNGGR
jgi:hypothetical protein